MSLYKLPFQISKKTLCDRVYNYEKLEKENQELKEEMQYLKELSCDDKTEIVIRAYKMALKKTLHYLYLKCKNEKEFIVMWGNEFGLLGELDTLLEEWRSTMNDSNEITSQDIQNAIKRFKEQERPSEEQEKLFKEYYWNQKIRGRTVEDRIKERMKELEGN
jgi:hypothetical protein